MLSADSSLSPLESPAWGSDLMSKTIQSDVRRGLRPTLLNRLSKHPTMANSKSATGMMALPNEILEKIILLADETSTYTLADAHPRLRDICLSLVSMESIKSFHVHHVLEHFIATRPSDVTVLDLSDCWTGSLEMRTLIQKCYNVKELNVVNSSLTPEHFLEVLASLRMLKRVSATTVDVPPTAKPSRYPSIERIYLEFAPSEADVKFVVGLLRGCTNAKHLYLMAIGRVRNAISTRDVKSCGESLAKYDTVIIQADMRHGWTCEGIFQLIFIRYPPRPIRMRQLSTQGLLVVERNDLAFPFRGLQLERPPMPGTIADMYLSLSNGELLNLPREIHSRNIYGLRTYFSFGCLGIEIPPLNVLSSVVEIDFSRSHLLYPARSWQALVDSSPAVETLALPSCSLLTNGEAFGSPLMDEEVVSTLTKLKLKRLCVRSSGMDECPRCFFAKLLGNFMTYMGELDGLEELTMDGMRLGNDFLDLVENSLSIRTLKLKVFSMPDEYKLMTFLKACPKLRNLKLDAADLPISSDLFWHAVSGAGLKQLCLYSKSPATINSGMLRINAFWLFKTLDILHLHSKNTPELNEVEAVIAEEARIANLTRVLDPVNYIVTQQCPKLEMDSRDQRLPGRSLCFMENFIGRPKPVGWDSYA